MQVALDHQLKPHNTLSLPGRARAFAQVESEQELVQALDWAARQNLPPLPLGEGSNVVFAGELDALVIALRTQGVEILDKSHRAVRLRVAAGENWHSFVSWSVQQGYYGLENLALIPGTVGAAPIQNIGAYGVELDSRVRQVHVLRLADGARLSLDRAQCAFGYRDSIFKGDLRDRCIVTGLELELSLTPEVKIDYPTLAQALQGGPAQPTPQDVFEAVVAIRSSKLPDPANIPNAGSFFKNPVLDAHQALALSERFPKLPMYPQPDGRLKLPAAWLIEQCGFKGARRDGVGVHTEHALVLVNYGDGDGVQLLALADEIVAAVADTFGVALVIEPRVYR